MVHRSNFWTGPHTKHLDQASQNWQPLERCRNDPCKMLERPSRWNIFRTWSRLFSANVEMFSRGDILQRLLDCQTLCRLWCNAPWSFGGHCYVCWERDSSNICNESTACTHAYERTENHAGYKKTTVPGYRQLHVCSTSGNISETVQETHGYFRSLIRRDIRHNK